MSASPPPLRRALVAEALGTGFLIVAVVGSGIMAQRLSSDPGVQLLENAIATGGALIGLILMFGPVSGAHFNPVVTWSEVLLGQRRVAEAAQYLVAQVVGGALGTIMANVIFDRAPVSWSQTVRSSPALWLSEVVATVGLLLVIHGCVRTGRSSVVPGAVAAWIVGAYWFTSSTSFANPAVTIARMGSDSFAGIAPGSVPMFVLAQAVGLLIAVGLIRVLYPAEQTVEVIDA